ncbi:hypothetical protein PFLG_00452 [Plasmodium falciparum RAJ116]|uniref:Uncharacterized protein n=1 Tax=Plasmodium falciparum RAJ116 TaxID=580058 RepID=A0A0L0CTE0_PLAFA|nr:hypothetical protein PFLG_00452 [Plasmodium falciparum RAJ116]
MIIESNKYLNFYKLLNFDNLLVDSDNYDQKKKNKYNPSEYNNKRNNNTYNNLSKRRSSTHMNSSPRTHEKDENIRKNTQKKKVESFDSLNDSSSYNDDSINENELVVHNNPFDKKNREKKNYGNLEDNKFYDFNIIKYLMKYKNVVSNLNQDHFNKKDYSNESEGEVNDFVKLDQSNINSRGSYTSSHYNKGDVTNSSYDKSNSYSDDDYNDSDTSKFQENRYKHSYKNVKYNKSSDDYENDSNSSSNNNNNNNTYSDDDFNSYNRNRRNTQRKSKQMKNERFQKKNKKKNKIDQEDSTMSDEYNMNNDLYSNEYTNRSIFNDILHKAKKRKRFYDLISNINRMKNTFNVNNINKNKTIDFNYIENIDTISYFISIYNSEHIFQFDYYFLKFIAEICTTYNNYIKSYLININNNNNNNNNLKYRREDLDKIINQVEHFLNEVTKLIYVYTWCILYIFGHSYSYVKYAKYFYQKKSFFLLDKKPHFIFNQFSYVTQESFDNISHQNSNSNSNINEKDDIYKIKKNNNNINNEDHFDYRKHLYNNYNDDIPINHFFNPSNIVENLKYNYELKRNTSEFDNFNFNNLIHIYKNSYFQNIVDKLQLNLKFIDHILFTLDIY